MAEPSVLTFVGVGAVVAVLDPVLGQAALITLGAVAGSMLAMSRANTKTWLEGLWFLLVGVMISIAITSAVVWALERYLQVPGGIALMPVAAAIGAGRVALLKLIDGVFNFLGDLLARKGGGS